MRIRMGTHKPLFEFAQLDHPYTYLIPLPLNPNSTQELLGFANKAIGPCTEDQDYMEKIKQLQAYLDMVKKMVKPGCSQQVLEVALSCITSLVNSLSFMSSNPKFHSSL